MNTYRYASIRMVRNRLPALLAMVLMVLSAFEFAAASAVQAAMPARVRDQATPASGSPGLNDPQELEAFLDAWIMPKLSEEHIAGATVAVVKDGALFFSKGYGYANVEAGIPVDPETTLFRVGSIGKLFTWTAVMQLVEQGRLDLDADVNQYLDFTIPATFPEPVTLRHLMTHTAGFEETAFGFAASRPEDLVALHTWLSRNMPARAWAPGREASYSNYGAALAGYIVERVSGMPYAQYIEQHILTPLGMTRSTLSQPLPAGLAADLSLGYAYIDGAFQPQGFEYLNMIPAGGLNATATDMARFMIAHLQQGRACASDCAGNQARILEATTAQQMQSRLWAPDERFNGMAHGFIEFSQNGYRVIGHPGDTPLFHSVLALLPEQNVGLFFSYNTNVYGQAKPLLEAFMDQYYPAAGPGTPEQLLPLAEPTARFAGHYQPTRYAYHKGGKLMSMFGSFPVQAGREGELVIDVGDGPQRFAMLAPLYFEENAGDLRLVFHEDANGEIAYLYSNIDPYMAYRKVAWYETQSFNLGLLGLCAALFLLVLLAEPVRLLTGWFKRRTGRPQPALARLARGVLAALALTALSLIVGLYLQINEKSAGIPMGDPGLLPVLGGLAILAVALASGTLVLAVLAWRRGWWGRIARLYYSVVAAAALAFTWFLAFWNQIGWQWW